MTTPVPTLESADYSKKTVLCRVDFNVPLTNGIIADDTRIQAALPTIRALLEKDTKLILISHLGRPKGERVPSLSLMPVGARLAELLQTPVTFSHSVCGKEVQACVDRMNNGEVLLLENLRFDPREKSNDRRFASSLAKLADLFVNDAFGTMHRAHASVTGVPKKCSGAAGLLVQRELEVLSAVLDPSKRASSGPIGAILGGAKVSDKMGVLDSLAEKVDHLFIGGAMAYTFLEAQGKAVGKSLVERSKIQFAKDLLARCESLEVTIHLPTDHVTAAEFSETAEALVGADIPDDHMGMDIGPDTINQWKDVLTHCKTILWNGPLGVSEWSSFASGTQNIAQTLADHSGFTVIGGGDSAAAIQSLGLADKFSHVSTGGGATLRFLERGDLVGLAALRQGGAHE
jgi:phosphoglycerate kinase